jgi:hypothetical protein
VLLRGSMSQQQQTGSKATKQASLRTILCQPATSIDGRAMKSQTAGNACSKNGTKMCHNTTLCLLAHAS